MRVEILVNVGDVNTTIDVTHDEISRAIVEEDNSERSVLFTISNFYQYMKAIPDNVIIGMTASQKNIAHDFLLEQSERFTQ